MCVYTYMCVSLLVLLLLLFALLLLLLLLVFTIMSTTSTTVSSHHFDSQNDKLRVSNPIFKCTELCVKPK